MSGIVDLSDLLNGMSPQLDSEEYVFCTTNKQLRDYVHLTLLGSFAESEGLTLILRRESADAEQLDYEGIFRRITLCVHSSLQAVGLTAAVAEKLTQHGISANVVAAYYHDHIFVQQERAQDALTALKGLTEAS